METTITERLEVTLSGSICPGDPSVGHLRHAEDFHVTIFGVDVTESLPVWTLEHYAEIFLKEAQ